MEGTQTQHKVDNKSHPEPTAAPLPTITRSQGASSPYPLTDRDTRTVYEYSGLTDFGVREVHRDVTARPPCPATRGRPTLPSLSGMWPMPPENVKQSTVAGKHPKV
ncbi:Hypothetical predicted protein [Pelobates cultripes]|uniref:Uncharacterized protein n=1 Tax=Pelobates cultripes TaxID=61616 RepID=A0AAD1RGB5_PELCU|nr:Hypothetical predicted protein [Pelobates cultripes]